MVRSLEESSKLEDKYKANKAEIINKYNNLNSMMEKIINLSTIYYKPYLTDIKDSFNDDINEGYVNLTNPYIDSDPLKLLCDIDNTIYCQLKDYNTINSNAINILNYYKKTQSNVLNKVDYFYSSLNQSNYQLYKYIINEYKPVIDSIYDIKTYLLWV